LKNIQKLFILTYIWDNFWKFGRGIKRFGYNFRKWTARHNHKKVSCTKFDRATSIRAACRKFQSLKYKLEDSSIGVAPGRGPMSILQEEGPLKVYTFFKSVASPLSFSPILMHRFKLVVNSSLEEVSYAKIFRCKWQMRFSVLYAWKRCHWKTLVYRANHNDSVFYQ
jgi:hypothetical protein